MAVNPRACLVIESDGATATESLVVTRPFRLYDAHGVVRVQGNAGNTTAINRQTAGGGFQPAATPMATTGAVGALVRCTIIQVAQEDFIAADGFQFANTGGDTTGRLLGYASILPR